MVGRSLRPAENKKDTLIIDHSGCVYEHGFPEDVPKWELKTSKEKERKKKEPEPIEKQPFTCVQCDTVYKPTKDDPACPNCAFIPTKKEQMVLIQQGRLIELPKMKPNPQDKENFYAQLVYYAKQKGFKEGWASWTFKRKYGHFPHSKKVFPVATGKADDFSICFFDPNKTEPMGAPKPFDKHIEMVSNNVPYCSGVSFFATKALNKRAPSK